MNIGAGQEDPAREYSAREEQVRKASVFTAAAIALVTVLVLSTGALAGYPWVDMGGGMSGYEIEALCMDRVRNILYVGTDSGVFRCANPDSSSRVWSPINAGLGNTSVHALAYDQGANILYAGTEDDVWRRPGPHQAGLWADIGGPMGDITVPALAYDEDSDMLFAGTNGGANPGVWRLSQPANHSNWFRDNGSPVGWINKLLVYDGMLLMGLPGHQGIRRCDDPTATLPLAWKDIGGGASQLGSATVNGFVVDEEKGIAYVIEEDGTRHRVWRSKNPLAGSGVSWTSLSWPGSGGSLSHLALDTAKNVLYASSLNGVLRCDTPDGTPGWSDTGGLENQGPMVYDDDRQLLYVGGNYEGVFYAELPSPAWYLAEGSTAWGFSTYITIQNPNSSAVDVSITYNTAGGPVSGGAHALPASSQTTVNPADVLGEQDFSTRVMCTDGKTVAVDRTMTWTGEGAASEEAHAAVGVTSPATTWYLPEGSSKWGFECWLLIQNPNSSKATCDITYMIENGTPVTVTKEVAAGERSTFFMADDIGSEDASIKVESDIPVIPERAMYRNNRRAGHDSTGTTTPAKEYFLAEGATGYNVGYITYVLVQNPQGTATDVEVDYLTGSGPVEGPRFEMPANSRKTIRVNDQLPPDTDVSTMVTGSAPIIAERAMYWDNGTGEAGHDSIGMEDSHTVFYLPDGQTSNGRETWTLVQNPNSVDVTVRVTYMTETGAGNVTFDETVSARSRKTFDMSERLAGARAAVKVESRTAGRKIMVERAMYWNSRGAGTNTVGGYAD